MFWRRRWMCSSHFHTIASDEPRLFILQLATTLPPHPLWTPEAHKPSTLVKDTW